MRPTTAARKTAESYAKALRKFAAGVGYDPADVRVLTDPAEIKRMHGHDVNAAATVIFEVGSIDINDEGVYTDYGPIELKYTRHPQVLVEPFNTWSIGFYADA